MGFFDKFKGNNTSNQSAATPAPTTGALNLSKEQRVNALNLKKQDVHAICLKKPQLTDLTSRVALVLDYSGSMSDSYADGTVQSIVENIFPIALEFDDNKSMEMWIFENGFHRLPDLTMDNFHGYVGREIRSKYSMGGTNYAPVMKDIIKRYIKEEPASIPNYVVFITDGNCFDGNETTRVITDAATQPIFWQFVGIGRGPFDYLEKLDDMSGRFVDNADFFSVRSAADIKYEKLLDEYPGWIANPKVQDMLK